MSIGMLISLRWAQLFLAMAAIALLADVVSLPANAQVFTPKSNKTAPTKPKKAMSPKANATSANAARSRFNSRPEPKSGRTYSDPVAYCAAYGRVDEVGKLYNGPALPPWILRAIIKLDGPIVTAEPMITWRCYNSRVRACVLHDTDYCVSLAYKATIEPAWRQFCRESPNSVVPTAVTGSTLAFVVQCRGKEPYISKTYFSELDDGAFRSDQWYDVTGYAPPPKSGAVAGELLGSWGGNTKSGIWTYYTNITLIGGNSGNAVGTAVYSLTGGVEVCRSLLVLRDADDVGDTILVEEQTDKDGIGCPGDKMIALEAGDGQLGGEWHKKTGTARKQLAKKPKPTMKALLNRLD